MKIGAVLVLGLVLFVGTVFAEMPPATSSDRYEFPIEGIPYASFNVVELREPVVLFRAPVILSAIERLPPATSSDAYTLFEFF